MSSICLCMIVKDESHVIERCLSSVRPFIDHWLVVDTGSTDGTQDLVRATLDGVPGELVERPWRDFGSNRTEALELARHRAEYSLVIDADEVLAVPEQFAWPSLVEDSYSLLHRHGSFSYWRTSLVANRLDWRYVGVLHEYLEASGAGQSIQLEGPAVLGFFDGGRSQSLTTTEKYARDARTLEKALVAEPDNPRYQFYLARSYRDSEQWGRALTAFRKRAEMGGFDEEVFDSLHAIGQLYEVMGSAPETVIAAYLAAYEYRPARAEPLVSLARYFRERERFVLAKLFADQAMRIPRPPDVLFVDDSVYLWRAQDEFAIAAYWSGDHAASAQVSRALLDSAELPGEHRDRVRQNLAFAEGKLGRAI
jgi:tetratricopeptide (TPR) repeat protein